jgi:hypothetical protein
VEPAFPASGKKRAVPLVRIEIPETMREGLTHISLIRREELDGFVEGLFGKEQSLEFPERTHHSLDALSELRTISTASTSKAREGG